MGDGYFRRSGTTIYVSFLSDWPVGKQSNRYAGSVLGSQRPLPRGPVGTCARTRPNLLGNVGTHRIVVIPSFLDCPFCNLVGTYPSRSDRIEGIPIFAKA